MRFLSLALVITCAFALGAMQVSLIKGPLSPNTATIVGTSKKVWGIDDIWMSPRSFQIIAIRNYLAQDPSMCGEVYYVKIDDLGYCVHESWIDQQDLARYKASDPTV